MKLWCLANWRWGRRGRLGRRGHQIFSFNDTEEVRNVESLQYSFNIVKAATGHFSHANKLCQGGFGAVYKEKLAEGKEIAVKRLAPGSGQGDLGFKNERRERLVVYEYVPKGSLDQFIFDPLKRTCLDWETRFKIIGGIARGLLYLHEDSRYYTS